MERDRLIELLARSEGYVSGEKLSGALSVTRAAVWKEISALRQAGWPIVSAPRLGYRLEGTPPILSGAYLSGKLSQDSLFSGKILVEDRVDSTNTRLKAMAAQGAAEGTVLLAEEQSGGRGTRGRSFSSPRGEGLYLSLLLRPKVKLEALFSLTGWAAVAARRGIQAACGAQPQIKWLNDLYLNGKKLVGILTELSLLGESGEPDFVVVGIGVNVSQSVADFQDQGLEDVAVSLAMGGYETERNTLAVGILEAFEELYRKFPWGQSECLEEYRSHCMTLGRPVAFQAGEQTLEGVALSVGEDISLLVRGEDGREHRVSSGTVRLL